MDFESLLNPGEKIQLKVIPKKGIMLHANDLFKILFAIFFMTIAFGVGLNYHIGFLILGIISLVYILKAIYIRYNNTNGIVYLITNERIMFLRKGNIIKQKKLKDIKEVTFENSGNNTGYIILGEVEPLFDGRGLSISEDKYVLDNLTNYKEVSDLIKKLIKN